MRKSRTKKIKPKPSPLQMAQRTWVTNRSRLVRMQIDLQQIGLSVGVGTIFLEDEVSNMQKENDKTARLKGLKVTDYGK